MPRVNGDIVIVFFSLIAELAFYAVLVLVHGGGGEFLQAAIVGTAVALAALARNESPPK